MTTLGGVALTKRYGNAEVVRSVDIEVHPSEVVGLLRETTERRWVNARSDQRQSIIPVNDN